jgi:cytochrome c oxidase subunit 1
MNGLRDDRREALLTSPVDAVPVNRWAMPDPSIWPLWSAIALTIVFVWSIFNQWGVVWGAIPVAIAMTIWFWPKKTDPSLGGGQ